MREQLKIIILIILTFNANFLYLALKDTYMYHQYIIDDFFVAVARLTKAICK